MLSTLPHLSVTGRIRSDGSLDFSSGATQFVWRVQELGTDKLRNAKAQRKATKAQRVNLNHCRKLVNAFDGWAYKDVIELIK